MKTKQKKANFIIKLPIYPMDIMVSLGQRDEEVVPKLRRLQISEDNIDKARMNDSTNSGRYCMFDNNASLIRLWNYPTTTSEWGTLAHEIFHAVTHILNKVGMDFQIGVSEEAYAYLIGFITTEIYKKIL